MTATDWLLYVVYTTLVSSALLTAWRYRMQFYRYRAREMPFAAWLALGVLLSAVSVGIEQIWWLTWRGLNTAGLPQEAGWFVANKILLAPIATLGVIGYVLHERTYHIASGRPDGWRVPVAACVGIGVIVASVMMWWAGREALQR